MKIILIYTVLIFSSWTLIAQTDEAYSNFMLDSYNTDLKERTSESVLLSGNKFGIKLGISYVLDQQPTYTTSFFLDLPFSKRVSAGIELGPSFVFIDEYTVNSVKYKGSGMLSYLSMQANVKVFIKSWWIGSGFSFNKFLTGNIRNESNTPNEYYPIDDADDELYLILTSGYMAELKENIFLMPDLQVGYRLYPIKPHFFINFGLMLGFRL